MIKNRYVLIESHDVRYLTKRIFQNLAKTKRLRISEGVDYYSLSKDGLKKTLSKVLQDPTYSTNALKWSAKFRDQKDMPLARAIWWIEYLLRNPDCDYLKSPVIRLGYVAGNSYDVIAFIVMIFVAIFILFITLICICANKIMTRNSSYKNCPQKKQK